MSTHSSEQKQIIESDAGLACIFACAGSGKTYTLTHRIAHLIHSHQAEPSQIATITFTNLAAQHLRASLTRALGDPRRAAEIYAGTIHSFCLALLQSADSTLDNEYEVLTDAQQWIVLTEHWDEWGLDSLAPGLSHSDVIDKLMTSLAIAKMESVDLEVMEQLQPELLNVMKHYREYCEANSRLDFADLLVNVRDRLRSDERFREHAMTRYSHLFVDEYQDVDPVQAEIVSIFADSMAVWVVGDDDQAIYQFRGTNYRNILDFASAPGRERYKLTVNRRCRSNIVSVASDVAERLRDREPKEMSALHSGGRVVMRDFDTVDDEAAYIASEVRRRLASGDARRPGDFAVLLRSVASYGSVYIDALRAAGIPVVVRGGRGLFRTPEVKAAWAVLEWLVRPRDAAEAQAALVPVVAWDLDVPAASIDESQFAAWQALGRLETIEALREKNANFDYETLQDLLFDVIAVLGLLSSTRSDAVHHNAAELTRLIDAYLSVNQTHHLSKLCGFLASYASRATDESAPVSMITESVNVLTMHQAKGLEFPHVFMPMLVERRFPLEIRDKRWLLDDSLFDAARYYGTDDAERRLLYVALTRAEDNTCLTYARDVGLKNPKRPSRYYVEIADALPEKLDRLDGEERPPRSQDEPFLVGSYSSLEYYLTCPYRYRLRVILGLSTPQNPFFKFGQVVHAVVGRMAQARIEEGRVPNRDEAIAHYHSQFDHLVEGRALPPYVIQRTRKRGLKALDHLFASRIDWIANAESVEKEFNYASDRSFIRGRMDLVVGNRDGSSDIVDIKTGKPQEYLRPDFQMMFYALTATRQLGMPISRATLYYIEHDEEKVFPVTDGFLDEAEERVSDVVDGILAGQFSATSGSMCTRCEVRVLCEYHPKRGNT